MNDDFAVFIVTFKRADRQHTYNYLTKHGYAGKIYFVLSDDDDTIPEYQKAFGKDRCLIFNKEESLSLFDIGDNFDDNRAVVYARNKIYDLAKSVGIRYMHVVDDDYTMAQHRIGTDGSYPKHKFIALNLNPIYDSYLNYFKSANFLSLAFMQGGDYIGGKDSGLADGYKPKRKVMNGYFFDVEKPMFFSGRLNEDLTASALYGLRGELLLSSPLTIYTQLQTQSNEGGLTDIYLNLGTYVKSFYSVMMAPSCVKIAAMGDKHKRIHHQVTWNNCASKILSEKWQKQADHR